MASGDAGYQRRLCLFIAALLWLTARAPAQYILEDTKDPHRYDVSPTVVPVAYFSENLDLAGGFAGYMNGLFQPQVQTYAFIIGSGNGSYGLQTGLSSLQLKPIDRLFLDLDFYVFRTEEDTNSVQSRHGYLNQVAGSNDSSEFNQINSPTKDIWGNFTFRYLLPIGDGTDRLIDHYVLNDGLLDHGASGASAYFNPLTSGRTFVCVAPQFEYMSVFSRSVYRRQWDTNGAALSLIYDNRDWVLTPSHGNMTTLTATRDFGIWGSSNPWTNLSAEFAQYIPLGMDSIFRQRVLALDAWTSYSPTTHYTMRDGHLIGRTAPPFYDGATLGGDTHLRAYPEERFHDRAGVFGSAELRVIPYWNPFNDIPALKFADVAWLQFVTFVEVGRVGDEYTYEKLFSHMKGDAGVGIRIMTQDTVVRIDLGFSNEGIEVWANLGQAF